MTGELHVSLFVREDTTVAHNYRANALGCTVSMIIQNGDGSSVSIVGDEEDFKRLFGGLYLDLTKST